VAIAHHSDKQSKLGGLLAACGLDVVLNTTFDTNLVHQLAQNEAGEALQKEYLDTLFEQLDMPIVFSDHDVTVKDGQTEEELGRKLSNKLISLFSRGRSAAKVPVKASESEHPQADRESLASGDKILQPTDDNGVTHGSDKENRPANRVWVLTGSMGGIEAIKRFLSALPDNLPIAFIIAQYISENIVAQATRLIAVNTTYQVIPAHVGHVINHHEVIMMPVVDESLIINQNGQMSLAPPAVMDEISITIDNILSIVAKRYGRNAGAIIFSGIGRVGIDGCKAITDHGGVVWTQDAESSRFASMPQYVRDACTVSYTATPELMAKRLAEDLDLIGSSQANTPMLENSVDR